REEGLDLLQLVVGTLVQRHEFAGGLELLVQPSVGNRVGQDLRTRRHRTCPEAVDACCSEPTSQRRARRSTTKLPMLSDEVAAGEGALETWIARCDSTIKKSSTIVPSTRTAWARIPQGAGSRSSADSSGTRRCNARRKARLLSERHISSRPVRQ